MTRKLEFFLDVGSPATYLAYTQIFKIADANGAELQLRPFLLGGVFKATGNSSPITVEAKGNYLFKDLMRFAQRYEVEFGMNQHFPINTLFLMRGAVAADMDGHIRRYLDVILSAVWRENLNMADPTVVSETLVNGGLDAERIIRRSQEGDVKTALIAATGEAVARGAFGAPTFFVGDDMYFGQDRLDFVADALAAKDS